MKFVSTVASLPHLLRRLLPRELSLRRCSAGWRGVWRAVPRFPALGCESSGFTTRLPPGIQPLPHGHIILMRWMGFRSYSNFYDPYLPE